MMPETSYIVTKKLNFVSQPSDRAAVKKMSIKHQQLVFKKLE